MYSTKLLGIILISMIVGSTMMRLSTHEFSGLWISGLIIVVLGILIPIDILERKDEQLEQQ